MMRRPTPAIVEPIDRLPRQVRDDRAFEVVRYDESYRPALQKFYEEFDPKRGAQGLPPAGPDRIDHWLASVLRSGLHFLALRRRELIGHALVMPTPKEGVGEYAVFLRRDMRGIGVGTELHRIVADTARDAGLHRLWLTVEPKNRAAIRSYEKAGFTFVPGTMLSMEPEMELSL